ncbi:MAG: helix-turn-helix transcriptional regulator [Ruminococcaceae bacterium]|nr:helix-turn-helix transcriptional regulator [Oscillospiraceae bacterium]NLC73335.1 helix-turn-helix transcriptional regulator [Oscillospiraceae bacterium]
MKNKVKMLRLALGLTQQQLADLVNVSARTIISIEKEQYNPSLMLAYKMSQIFNVSVEDLCCLEENLKMENNNENKK